MEPAPLPSSVEKKEATPSIPFSLQTNSAISQVKERRAPSDDILNTDSESKKPDLGSWGKYVTHRGKAGIYMRIESRESFRNELRRLKKFLNRRRYVLIREFWKRRKAPQRVILEFRRDEQHLKLLIRQKISGRIALVIDDMGHNRKWLDLLQEMDRPITLAVLPYMAYSKRMAGLQGENFEIILHLPMENVSGMDPGPGAIFTNMSDEEIRQNVRAALDAVPGAVGANNHMGSKATADARVMALVLEELNQKNLIFLDSLTGPSLGLKTAREKGIYARSRDVFLDDRPDPEYIENQLQELKQIALRRGEAIGIGHFKEHTLKTIQNMVSVFEDEGVAFVFLSDFYSSFRKSEENSGIPEKKAEEISGKTNSFKEEKENDHFGN